MILILPLITHVKLNHWINKLTASCLTQADERSREQAYEGYKSRPSPEPPPTTSGLCKQVIFFFPFLPPHFYLSHLLSLLLPLFSHFFSLIQPTTRNLLSLLCFLIYFSYPPSLPSLYALLSLLSTQSSLATALSSCSSFFVSASYPHYIRPLKHRGV